MQISFKLGLLAQEIALLQTKEVARLNSIGTDFTLFETMSLPAAYTKGADVMKRSRSSNKRRSLSFDVERFDQMIRTVEKLAKAGEKFDPKDFYPLLKLYKGKSRDLPKVAPSLRAALTEYLSLRIKTGDAETLSPAVRHSEGSPLLPAYTLGAYGADAAWLGWN